MKPITVLLVDDNQKFLDITTQFLLLEGESKIRVLGTAVNGEEGIRKTIVLKPQIVLVDLAMPGLSGLDVITILRKEQPDLGIIALTLMETNGYRNASLSAGADDFLHKSVMNTDLLPKLRQVYQTVQNRG